MDEKVAVCRVLLEVAAEVDELLVVAFCVLDSEFEECSQAHSELAKVSNDFAGQLVLVQSYLDLALPVVGSQSIQTVVYLVLQKVIFSVAFFQVTQDIEVMVELL